MLKDLHTYMVSNSDTVSHDMFIQSLRNKDFINWQEHEEQPVL